MDKLKVRFQDGPITVTQLNYRGYEIHTYTSPNRYSRYIYKIGEVLDTVYDTDDRTVTVEDCKQRNYKGNIIKYILRYEKKGGVEDLEKARWYLNRLIACESVKE